MDRAQMNQMAEELIEQAKKMSKEKFLNFAEKMYGVDRSAWDHLWEVPVVPAYDDETIFPTELSSMSRDEIIDKLDECIESKIGEEEAVFITYEDIMGSLTDEAAQEYEEGVQNGKIPEKYNAVIVYNEAMLKSQFREHIDAGKNAKRPRTQEEINEKYLELTTETFIHELMHLNNNVLVFELDNPDEFREVNGVERGLDLNYRDFNEVLLDTVAKIINIYSEGDTIEDCLYKIIEQRGGSSAYKDKDDSLVLSMFTMFPEELTKWVMFEAYGNEYENIIEQKYLEIFGGNTIYRRDEMLRKVGTYFNKTASQNMTEDQFARRKEMLRMIGVRNIEEQQSQPIDVDQFRNMATSEPAMEQLSGSFNDMKMAYKESRNPEQQEPEAK